MGAPQMISRAAGLRTRTSKQRSPNCSFKFQMDETAIEAEAFRLCSEDLERLDRMLTLAEVRREKALRFVADYREHLWTRLRQTADRLLESDEVPRLISVRKRSD
jgi:hypothetical protein